MIFVPDFYLSPLTACIYLNILRFCQVASVLDLVLSIYQNEIVGKINKDFFFRTSCELLYAKK